MPPKKETPKTRLGSKKASRSKSPTWWRWTKRSIAALTALLLVCAIGFGAVFAVQLRWAQDRMASLPNVMQEVGKRPSVIVSSDGKVLYQVSAEFRHTIKIEGVPDRVVRATLAAEDKRFFEHKGVDYISMGRAVFNAGKKGGGSTLTMQLAKRIYTSTEKSMLRKVRDMALAVEIERHRTKNQILELYLNQVYYGNGAYGIEAAAETYFGKTINDLTISESAMLARLVRRPSDENPYANLTVAMQNRDVVLGVMLDENWITAAEYKHAIAEKPLLKPKRFASGAKKLRSPYFVGYILSQLEEKYPDIDLSQGGYRIETTLNTTIDDFTQASVQKLVSRFKRQRVTTAAFVLMNEVGQIKAMIGGVDFNRNQYNVISQGHRQPGSSFKPFVYATALSRGALRPNDSISNERFTWRDGNGKVWEPKNSGGGYGGSYSVASALAFSKNVPAVRVCEAVGPETVVAYAHDVFGFSSHLLPVLSLGLGTGEVTPLEMAEGYSVFMLGGDRATPFGILRIIGPGGEVIATASPDIHRGMLDRQVCDWMDGFLRGVVTGGTGKRASGVKNARGKTGTTQDNKDAWFCGYTGSLVGIGWIANETFDASHHPVYGQMPGVFGGEVTVQLWRDVMMRAGTIFGGGTSPNQSSAVDEEPRRKQREDPPPVDETPADVHEEQPAITPNTSDAVPEPPKRQKAPREQARPTPNDRQPPKTDGDVGGMTVSVEVCADTGMRATMYCPETVTRRFPSGTQPKKFCTKHGNLQGR